MTVVRCEFSQMIVVAYKLNIFLLHFCQLLGKLVIWLFIAVSVPTRDFKCKKFKVQGGLNFEPEAWNLGGFAP